MEATSGIEPEYTDLQSAASPLRHVASQEKFLLKAAGLCKSPRDVATGLFRQQYHPGARLARQQRPCLGPVTWPGKVRGQRVR